MPKFSPARLTAARIQAGLTQRELAARVGRTSASHTYESGRAVPPDYMVGLLAQALGIRTVDLFEPDEADPVYRALAALDSVDGEVAMATATA